MAPWNLVQRDTEKEMVCLWQCLLKKNTRNHTHEFVVLGPQRFAEPDILIMKSSLNLELRI